MHEFIMWISGKQIPNGEKMVIYQSPKATWLNWVLGKIYSIKYY